MLVQPEIISLVGFIRIFIAFTDWNNSYLSDCF